MRRASRKPQRGFLYITPRKKNDAVGQENIENMEPWFSLCVFLRKNRSRRGQWRHSIHIQYTTPRNDAWFSVDLTIWMGKFILQPNIAIENHPISTIIYDLWENIYLNQSMFDCHLGFDKESIYLFTSIPSLPRAHLASAKYLSRCPKNSLAVWVSKCPQNPQEVKQVWRKLPNVQLQFLEECCKLMENHPKSWKVT